MWIWLSPSACDRPPTCSPNWLTHCSGSLSPTTASSGCCIIWTSSSPLAEPALPSVAGFPRFSLRISRCPAGPPQVEGPDTVLEFLGILLDSQRMEARLPPDMRQRLQTLIAEWLPRRSCTKRELLSLIGLLHHACKVVVPGRTFLRRMIDLSCTARELHHHIRLSKSFRLDLLWWHTFLSSWNGKYFPLPRVGSTPFLLYCVRRSRFHWVRRYLWLTVVCLVMGPLSRPALHHVQGTFPHRFGQLAVGPIMVAPARRLSVRQFGGRCCSIVGDLPRASSHASTPQAPPGRSDLQLLLHGHPPSRYLQPPS